MTATKSNFFGKSIIKSLYDKTIRRYIPEKIVVFNGVPVAGFGRILDATNEKRNYKEANISALRDHVRPGENVVVIGGGFGVSAVVAARKTGEKGTVTVYEADSSRIENLKETININRVENICRVKNCVVGHVIEVPGELDDAETVSVSDLPDCDVLEMDCEGAEGKIIENLDIFPQIIIVETHPEKGPSTESIKSKLTKHGYTILSIESDPIDGHILIGKLNN